MKELNDDLVKRLYYYWNSKVNEYPEIEGFAKKLRDEYKAELEKRKIVVDN